MLFIEMEFDYEMDVLRDNFQYFNYNQHPYIISQELEANRRITERTIKQWQCVEYKIR